MTLDQIIALNASIAAALSAFATLATVRQISKQREASYRPELMFASKQFSVRAQGGEGPADQWHEGGQAENGTAATHFQAGLNLINIGLGAAKHVRLGWDFPIQKMVNDTNNLAQRALASTYIDYEDLSFTIKRRDGSGETFMWKNQQTTLIDYVLPANASSLPPIIYLPSAYLVLIELSLHFVHTAKNMEELPSIPPLAVSLAYQDIGGREISATFELSFELFMTSASRFDGRFVSQRTKGPSLLSAAAAELPSIASSIVSSGVLRVPRL